MASLQYESDGVFCEHDLGEKTVIGSSPQCDLILENPTVSGRHCMISQLHGECHIKGLSSRSAVLVNSERIRKTALHEGDVITVGSFTLNFSETLDRSPLEEADGRLDDDECLSPHANLRVRKAISSPETVKMSSLALLKKRRTPSKKLEDLWDLASELTHLQTPEELCSLLLPRILVSLGGDRARVVLRDEKTGEMNVLSAVGRTKASKRSAFRFPRRLQELVVQQKRALLVQDAPRDRRLDGSHSTVEQRIRSAIVTPLLERQKCIGLLEADSTTVTGCYDGKDLKFLCIIAHLFSSALISCLHYSSVRTENSALRLQFDDNSKLLIGDSSRFQSLLARAKQVAQSDATILLLGESGTGKNLLAKAMHSWNSRSEGPFIEISCPTLPDTLLESELFGYEKGAFTGAFRSKRGRIEMAQAGTLFLDEIGDLSDAMQAKLLQFLDSRVLQRLGATASTTVDVRIIASTNRDLPAEAEAGRFRRDLFHRLDVVSLCLPPLRDRKEDIPVLASHFSRTFGDREGKPGMQISDQAMEILFSYDWPGNIRELENVIEKAVILCEETVIFPEHVLTDGRGMQALGEPDGAYHAAVRDASKRIIQTALAESGGVQREAAKKLGLNETYLAKLIKKFGIKK